MEAAGRWLVEDHLRHLIGVAVREIRRAVPRTRREALAETFFCFCFSPLDFPY